MPSRNIHLVGSVPLANAHEVFVTVSAALGPYLLRIPDGETGERSDWIAHLEPVFANHPALEKSDEVFRLHPTARGRTRYRLKPGASATDVTFENLFYADTAIQSYREFASLKEQGKIPARCRFQVDLVPAHSVIWLFLQDDLHPAFDPIYNDAVRREIDKLARAIPHRELAIQIRCRLGGIRAAAAQRAQRLWPQQERNARRVRRDPGQACRSCPGGYRAVVSLLLRRFQSPPRGRADRHGRSCEQACARHRSLDRADPHAGPARSLGRCLFRPAQATRAQAGHAALPRSRALHGRDRRHAPAPCHGGKICEELFIATECGFGRRPRDTISELLAIHAAAAE